MLASALDASVCLLELDASLVGQRASLSREASHSPGLATTAWHRAEELIRRPDDILSITLHVCKRTGIPLGLNAKRNVGVWTSPS